MSLSKVLREMNKIRPFAEENVDEGPRETLAGRRGRKNQALSSLARLNKEYTSNLRQTAAFVLVVGDKREEFTKLATESYKCFSADPDFFYTDLARRVPTALYLGKEGMSNIFDVLGRHLEDKANELDIVGYPQLIFRQEYRRQINTSADFVSLVKQAINEQVGGELVGLQSIKSLTEAAIKKNHNAKVTPILLPTGDEKFALTIARALERISSKIFVVAAGETSAEMKRLEGVFTFDDSENGSVKEILKTISGKTK